MKTLLYVSLLVIALLSVSAVHADLAIVSADSSGSVSFAPTAIVLPVVNAVLACVVAATGLVIIWHFTRWLWHELKREPVYGGIEPMIITPEQRARIEAINEKERHFEWWADRTGWGSDNGTFSREDERLGPGF